MDDEHWKVCPLFQRSLRRDVTHLRRYQRANITTATNNILPTEARREVLYSTLSRLGIPQSF